MATIQVYIGESLISTYEHVTPISSRAFDGLNFFFDEKLIFRDQNNKLHTVHISSITTVIITEE